MLTPDNLSELDRQAIGIIIVLIKERAIYKRLDQSRPIGPGDLFGHLMLGITDSVV